MRTAWTLGARKDLAHLRLRAWAQEILQDDEDGLAIASTGHTVEGGHRLARLRSRWPGPSTITTDHLDLEGDPDPTPEIPPHIAVWRSVRSTGDTKTRKSRRTLALPGRAIDALKIQRERQGWQRVAAGAQWQETGLVFTSAVGTALDAANVRREFRKILTRAAQVPGIEIEPREWTTRETRTSFVSILSDRGHPAGGDLPARRPLQHGRHGGGLPEADPPGDPDRGRRHGCDLRYATSPETVVTQVVTHNESGPLRHVTQWA
ncbi:hypothetical protein ACFVIM_17575 [Streptomyces sp. NPDC057638]|uniref:hypothetical protein n=1 Tax=Streptomyces sp. NPDC057638 TaxID=3346190 RepID=UPI0036B38D54